MKVKGGEKWLLSLRKITYEEKFKEILKFKGIGKKVSDCICLFALDCTDSVPIDTHVYQLYNRIYAKHNLGKKINIKDYDFINKFFKEKFGKHAGIAMCFLFVYELPKFKEKSENSSKKKSIIKKNEKGKLRNSIIKSQKLLKKK